MDPYDRLLIFAQVFINSIPSVVSRIRLMPRKGLSDMAFPSLSVRGRMNWSRRSSDKKYQTFRSLT